jgi:putative DNA primase/helicase
MNAAELAFHLHGKKSGAGWLARCPAHEDTNPSLSLKDGDDGRPLVHCHAGCDQSAVIAALRELGLWESTEREPSFNKRIECTYPYTDENGALVYEVVRLHSPKSFRQRYPDGRGGWVWRKHPNQVLYHLREVLENPIIFVCEGERDAETLRNYGFVGTTNAGGAKAPWLPAFTDALRGREVVLIPDRDPAGYERVKRIARALLGNVARLVYLELQDGKDVTAWFERGHSELELIAELDSEEVNQ